MLKVWTSKLSQKLVYGDIEEVKTSLCGIWFYWVLIDLCRPIYVYKLYISLYIDLYILKCDGLFGS